jgi:WD40 repeat protein
VKRIVLFASIVLSSIVGLDAQDKAKADDDGGGPIMIEAVKLDRAADFKIDILPILKTNCLACHNAKDKEGELVLETPADMLKGGENGPAVVPGKGADSLLIKAAAHLKKPMMPPKKNKVEAKPLTPRELGLLKLWIDQGAKVSTVVTLDAPSWQPTPANWNPIYAAALDADGQTAACGRAGRLYIYSVATGRLVAQPADPRLGGLAHRDAVQSIAFSPDGSLLATGGYRSIKIWRKQSPEQRVALDQTGEIKAATVSADGKRLAVATGENVITVYDLATGRPSPEMKGHADLVTSLRFSPEGQQLASGSADKTARVWTVADGAEATKITTPSAVNAVEWISAKQLATGGADNLVRVWALDQPAAPAKELKGHTAVVTGLAMTPAGLVSASQDGKATLWNVETGQAAKSAAHGGPITALAASPDGRRWVTVGGPAAKLWNAEAAAPAAIATLGTDGPAKRHDREAQQLLTFSTGETTYRTNRVKEAEVHKKAEEDEVKKATDAVPPADKDAKDKDDAYGKAKQAREAAEKDLAGTALAIQTGKAKLELATKALSITDPEQALLQAEADGAAALAALEEAAKKPETLETAKARIDSVNKMLAFARAATALARAQADKAAADQALAGLPAPDRSLATGTAKASADAKTKLDAASKALDESKAKLAAATEEEAKKKADDALKRAEADRAAADAALQKAQKEQQAAEAALAEASKKFAEIKTRADAAAATFAQAKAANDKARGALEGSRGAADQAIKTAEAQQKSALPKVDTAKKAEEAAMHAADISKANLDSAKGRVEKAKAEVLAADKGIADANAALEKQKQDQARLDVEKKQSAEAAVKALLPIRTAAFSADGAWVALGGEDGRVYTFGAEKGADARALEPLGRAVFATGLSADGSLVSLAPDGAAIIRRVAPTWTLDKTIEPGESSKPPVDRVLALAFSPDGKLLASGGGIPSRDGELLLWDPVEGKLVREVVGAHSDSVFDVSWSPDGSLLASAGADKFARISDPKTGKVIRNFEGHTNHVLAVGWNKTGRSIATGGADDVVKVWDVASGQQTRTIPGFTKQATKLRYVGLDASFIVAAGGVPVRLVQEAGNVARNYESGPEFMYTVALSADGGTLAAGSLDGVLRLWSTGTGTPIAVLSTPK